MADTVVYIPTNCLNGNGMKMLHTISDVKAKTKHDSVAIMNEANKENEVGYVDLIDVYFLYFLRTGCLVSQWIMC